MAPTVENSSSSSSSIVDAVSPSSSDILRTPQAFVQKAPDLAGKKLAEKASSWNTQNLGRRLGCDLAAACAAGVVVAPTVTIIDRAIIENASGRSTLMSSVRSSLSSLFLRPHVFLTSRPFALIFALYGGTYLSSNLLDTATSTIKNRAPASTTTGTSKFLTTSATNLSLCLYKDSQFTKLFGAASNGSRPVPGPTYALFALRDCLTVFASFNLPPLLTPHMAKWAEKIDLPQAFRIMSPGSTAQLLAPAAVQIFSTPLHLLGLDLYNREGVSARARAVRILRDYGASCLARVGRILPAFGVGGVVNQTVRGRGMQTLEA